MRGTQGTIEGSTSSTNEWLMFIDVRVQTDDFDLSAEHARLRAHDRGIGAIASFVGVVRDLNDDRDVSRMTLEHYPGMTERAIESIVREAGERWSLSGAIVIHRVGPLAPSDQIVAVVTGSAHRGESFAACEFIMDYLKTDAPFWKKETSRQGSNWVEARKSDIFAQKKWRNDSKSTKI